jgi:fructosamine-3-kinase
MTHNPFTTTLSNNTIKMRTFFLFSLLVAAASAFVAPANQAVAFSRASTVEAPKMMVDGSVFESAASTANLIATNSGDNGGAFFPVIGIVSLAALILYLAPPLVDAE